MVSKRGQAVLISLQNVRSAKLNGKKVQWTFLSGEGHCASAMARMECVEQGRSVSPIGALAQLGERLICIQEVNGSIPLGSTINGSVAQVVRAHA
jgi:hypothetical protein